MSAEPAFAAARDDGVELAVRVQPKASRDKIVGPLGDSLKIAVTAPPQDGKANAAVIALLAHALGVAKSHITITSGLTSRDKRVQLSGVSLKQVRSVFSPEAT